MDTRSPAEPGQPGLPTPLVSTEWLAARLGDPRLVVLDASWYLPQMGRDARAEFESGHPPGARFFDLDATSDPDTSLPHMLPSPALFAASMAALGVGDHSDVVVYDGSGIQFSAPRLWWMLRTFGHRAVAVLDGGLKLWQAEGKPLESGPAAPVVAGEFHPGFEARWLRSRAALEMELAAGSVQVVDARSAGRFRGDEPEPRPGLQGGHIPGSCNLPFPELIDPLTGRYRTPVELRRLLVERGLDLGRPVVTLCGSGVTASSVALALDLVGVRDVAVYDGSWAEWGRDGRVARGPAEPSP